MAQACARQRARGGDPVPSRRAQRRRAVRLSLGRRAQARAARAGGRGMTCSGQRIAAIAAGSRARGGARLGAHRRGARRHGCAVLERAAHAGRMCRARGGSMRRTSCSAAGSSWRGTASAAASTSTSPIRCRSWSRRCAPRSIRRSPAIANRWNEAMGIDVRYPAEHAEFLARCHEAGQTQADAAAAAIRRGRLQLPASGPLRRARVPAAGRVPAVATRARTSPAASSC